jgi:flagellar biosynthetic protein FliO
MNPDSTSALLAGSGALGQIVAGSDGTAFASAPALGPVLHKLALGLGAVIVLILVLQRMARRFGGGLPRRGDPIQLLAQRPLGPRLSLAVVEVMDRTFLVGVSPHGIEKVADLTKARERQRAARFVFEEQRTSLAERFEELSWKDRLTRSFAHVLSGGKFGAAPSRAEQECVGPSCAERIRVEPSGAQQMWEEPSPAMQMRNEPPRATRMREEPSPAAQMLEEALPPQRMREEPSPAEQMREEPSPARQMRNSGIASRTSEFEAELRRRLDEIQARYPQVSEIDVRATPRTPR